MKVGDLIRFRGSRWVGYMVAKMYRPASGKHKGAPRVNALNTFTGETMVAIRPTALEVISESR
jgi:hypothetical protein